jgi:hypothetical protein
MRRTALALVILVQVACGSSKSPTAATPSPTPVPSPTPTPTPTAAPTPTPDPLAACTPEPPPIYGFTLNIRTDQGYEKILGARPVVRDPAYCTSIGFPGYSICHVRPEGDPQAAACDNHVVGIAQDTGRYGPTWNWDKKPCRSSDDRSTAAGCRNHQTNQYQVYAFGPGKYMACAEANKGCKALVIN